MEIKLFTQSTCAKCPQIKAALENSKLQFSEYDVETPDGLAEMMMCGSEINVTPLLVVDDEVIGGIENQLDWIKKSQSEKNI